MSDVKDTMLWKNIAPGLPIDMLAEVTEKLQRYHDDPGPLSSGWRNYLSFNAPRANIDGCISWEDTDEGHEYWSRVNQSCGYTY